MSLLRALRAYVGLGPDEDYEEQYVVDGTRPASIDGADSRRAQRSRRRGTYLDDYYGRSSATTDEADDDVIDIRSARIDARRADGSEAPSRRPNQSRNRSGDRNAHRQQSLSENEQLLDQLSGVSPFDDEEPEDGFRDEDDFADETSGAHGTDESIDGETDDYGADADDEPDTSSHDDDGKIQGAVVRSIDSARSRPRTMHPESFTDAKHVADEFKRGAPVVINLQGLERDLVRRLVDFASGICYALDGSMEKLAPQVFLLTPDGLAISDTDRRRIEERGYAR